jgi:transposase InsO family protein
MQQVYLYDSIFKRRDYRNLTGLKAFTGLSKQKQGEVKKRLEIIEFFEKYGEEATREAFKKSRSTLYSWKKKLKDSGGDLRSLIGGSKAPRRRRQRIVNPLIKAFVIDYRKKHPRVGQDAIKPALDKYCEVNRIKTISPSTIGRLISDLKKEGKIKDAGLKVGIDARTGKLHIRNRKRGKKTRRKGYKPESPGDLVQIDSITEFVGGIRRYIITGIDLKTRFGFAWEYRKLSSGSAKDFMKKLEEVCPFRIKRVQTDNGSEFEKLFREYLARSRIIQFFNYPRRPRSNAYVERFNRTVKEQFVKFNSGFLIRDLENFNRRLMKYLLWYNTEKPHRGIKNLTPMDFYLDNFVCGPKKSSMYRDPQL